MMCLSLVLFWKVVLAWMIVVEQNKPAYRHSGELGAFHHIYFGSCHQPKKHQQALVSQHYIFNICCQLSASLHEYWESFQMNNL